MRGHSGECRSQGESDADQIDLTDLTDLTDLGFTQGSTAVGGTTLG